VRAVAAAAGVAPDVAKRYYRNRDALFAAAMRLPADPTTAIPALVAPGVEGMGERLVRFTLDLLADPHAREQLVSMVRSGVHAGHAMSGLEDFIERGVVDRVAGLIGVPDARMRSALITSYLIGIAITRYGVRLEPLASANEEEVIRLVSPVVQDLIDPRKPLRPDAAGPERGGQEARTSDGPGVRSFDPDPAATRAAAAARATREESPDPARTGP
jgi:AcrR family transcriptional regulator